MRSKFIKYTGIVLTGFLLFFVYSSRLPAQSFGKKVLAIYKSTDGYSEKNNPVKWFFEAEIKKYGLEIVYHDFDEGIPDSGSPGDIRAILTWYNSGVVRNKDTGIKYIGFLNKAIDSGVKLIFVNSFGAYGYNEDGQQKWDLINYINPLFIKMGFNFKGFWTNDPKKLKIVYADKSVTENKAKQDVSQSKHYQQIIPLRDDVKTYLTVKRLDYVNGIGDGKSSVIFTSNSGGFAMEQYVLRGNSLMLNPVLFLRNSLFNDDNRQNIAVVAGDMKEKAAAVRNIGYACRYAKVEVSFLEPAELRRMVSQDLYQYEIVLLALEDTKEIPSSIFKDYANSGGNIVFLRYANLDKDFSELLGVKEYSNAIDYFKEGFSIDPSFFMNRISISGSNMDLNVRKAILSKGRVLAEINNPGERKQYPVLWETSYGKGHVLYWNTNMLLEGKRFRGTIIQSMHYVCGSFISGLANIGMMMIDDFPAPLWNLNYKDYRIKYYNGLLENETDTANKKRLETIIKNLRGYNDISDTNFIKNVWVKDILSLQKKYGLHYSSYLIFNYSKDTGLKGNDGEFAVRDFYLAGDSLPIFMGRVAIDNGWEVGLHGYNHQSMTLTRPEKYASEPWPDKDAMIKALTAAHNEWDALYSSYMQPFSYVAPHNIIDDAGKSALGEVFKTIRVICTVYVGNEGESEQEFEWTKDGRFFQIPRLSSGYYMDAGDRFIIYDGLHNLGVISHFIHPDDVFDENRSSGFSGWAWMKKEFEKELSYVKKNFPWLRWMSVKDAFGEFQFYNSTNIRVKRTGKTILVESNDGSSKYLFFRLRLRKGQSIKKLHNCSQVYADRKSGDIILKTNEHMSVIELR
ncbi:MAG: DUF2194 domain-containing protein [Spirochaetes bacterium]|nr:DUF2194 domain-containing protein [Spirochaetota bacterium]